MAPDALKPTATEIVAAAMVHCVFQGACIPLLVDFLSSRRERGVRLKGYVICVNLLTLAQTALQVEQAFDALNHRVPRAPLVLFYPLLTVVLGALVQAFFIFRCWCILKCRWVLITPFLLLHIAAVVSGIIMSVYSMKSLSTSTGRQANLTFSVWIVCVFLLDLTMSATTITYIYRSRTGQQEHDHALNTIWQVIWTSALPPFLLMIAVIIEGHIGDGLAHPGAIFLSDMTGKLFVLSLMITLVGRGHIRQKLDQVSKRVDVSDTRAQKTTVLSLPVFASRHTDLNGFEMQSHFSNALVSTLSGESSTNPDHEKVSGKT